MLDIYILIVAFISFLNLVYIPFDPITKLLEWWEVVLKFIIDTIRVSIVWAFIFLFIKVMIKVMIWVFS